MVTDAAITIHRGRIISPRPDGSLGELPDGGLAVVEASGAIAACGPFDEVAGAEPEAGVRDHRPALLLPGFIDAHVHLAQVFARARVAGGLLAWLEGAIYPAEAAFADPEQGRRAAEAFVAEALRSGVTCAAVFLTCHTGAAERAFQVVAERGLRVVMGLVHMDRNAPAALSVDGKVSLAAAEALAGRWHGHDGGRIRYALTPRFALSCSAESMVELGRLRRARPDLHVHTHLAENLQECAEVARSFPGSADYVGVYEEAGLLGPGSIFAHGLHLSDREVGALASSGSGVAHCPSSNLFLKSGVFPWRRHAEAGVRFGLGSDVGAGPEMSPFRIMRDAYSVQPTDFLRPEDLLWRATLGGAQALGLDGVIGSLEPGKEADFVVVDPSRRPEIAACEPTGLGDLLAALVFLGDDRVVLGTYVRGRKLG